MTPEVALAASARDWPDRFHRHVLDHGGARVSGRVMGLDQVRDAAFDVLFIDDVCSFLTPRLVSIAKAGGAEVVGVFDPIDGSDAKARLLDCGISDVIESDATPQEFAEKAIAAISHRVETPAEEDRIGRLLVSVGVVGAGQGVGVTEVSTTLARQMGGELATCLIDVDPHWPSVGQRVDLPLHPNVRTVLDHALHRPDREEIPTSDWRGVRVIPAVADVPAAAPLRRIDVEIVLEALAVGCEVAILDMGPLDRSVPGLVSTLTAIVLVGGADPVGIARVHSCLGELLGLVEEEKAVVALNRSNGRAFYQSEARSELARAFPATPVLFLPEDRKLARAAWEGSVRERGQFARSVQSIARLLVRSINGG